MMKVAPKQAVHVDRERQAHLLDDAFRIDKGLAAVGNDAGDQRPDDEAEREEGHVVRALHL